MLRAAIVMLYLYGIVAFFIRTSDCDLFVERIVESTYVLTNVSVIHTCTTPFILCTQISIQTAFKRHYHFEAPSCIDCEKLRGFKDIQRSVLPIQLQDKFICTPDYWNPDPLFIKSARLHLFIISKGHLQTISSSSLSIIHKVAKRSLIYDLHVPEPYSRLICLKLRTRSPSFYHDILHWSYSTWQSPLVEVPIPLSSGVFTSNSQMGLYFQMPQTFGNPYFKRFVKSGATRFTLSFWMYLSSPCPTKFCNTISFFDDSNEEFVSPVILLTNLNEFHIQMKLESSQNDIAFRTLYNIPIRSWNHYVFSINPLQWSLTVFAEDGSQVGKSPLNRFPDRIKVNISRGIGVAGGSQMYTGIDGYFSDIYWHPGIIGQHKQIHHARRFLNSNLQISHEQRFQDCENLLNELHFYLVVMRHKLFGRVRHDACGNVYFWKATETNEVCLLRIRDLKRPGIYKFLRHVISKNVYILKSLKTLRYIDLKKTLLEDSYLFYEVLDSLKEHICSKVMEKIKNKGIALTRLMVNYLNDCACLGNADASYMLSTCYFYGVGSVKMNATKALELLLVNVNRHEHRLSMLALGNIHYLKLIPEISPLSSVFYKAVADYTPKDMDQLGNKDMFNDNIRLINEIEVKEHTDEDGDLFQWIQHQASSGIPWAKQRLARIFYWGGQGIRRNFDQALNYFKMAAEAPEAEAGDHFDYGLLLVKKPGEKADFEKGKSELKLASSNDPRALTVLGWLAETHEKNSSKAYNYYKEAYEKGNYDAGHNLGVFFHQGRANFISRNKNKAFHYFQEAAANRQLSSGAFYSHYLFTGLEGYLQRNIDLGIRWARFVGEQNPKVGYFISEGVRAFRKKQMKVSMFFYLLTAFSGLELANFNIAFLCEEHEGLVEKHIERECTWHHYNMSIQRDEQQIHAYSLIKMGDKHWYGCLDGQRNITTSIQFYTRAALKGEPQAYFNLGFILENSNTDIPYRLIRDVVSRPDISSQSEEWKHGVILDLYKRCEDVSHSDTYLPCRLASERLKMIKMWTGAKLQIQWLVTILISVIIVYKFINLWRHDSNRAGDNGSLPAP